MSLLPHCGKPAHVPHLELGAVHSRRVGGIDQLECSVEISVVVVADFSDKEAGGVIADAIGRSGRRWHGERRQRSGHSCRAAAAQ